MPTPKTFLISFVPKVSGYVGGAGCWLIKCDPIFGESKLMEIYGDFEGFARRIRGSVLGWCIILDTITIQRFLLMNVSIFRYARPDAVCCRQLSQAEWCDSSEGYAEWVFLELFR